MPNRPFTFPIFCARAKNKFKDEKGKTRYGCYPAGFLESARELLVRGNAEPWHYVGVLDLICPKPGKEFVKTFQVNVNMPDGARYGGKPLDRSF